MTLLIGEDLNILRVVFLLGKISKFSPARWNSPTIANFFSKVFGEKETIHIWWGQQSNIKESDIFGKNWNTEGIILGANPAEHCFVLRDFVETTFFK